MNPLLGGLAGLGGGLGGVGGVLGGALGGLAASGLNPLQLAGLLSANPALAALMRQQQLPGVGVGVGQQQQALLATPTIPPGQTLQAQLARQQAIALAQKHTPSPTISTGTFLL